MNEMVEKLLEEEKRLVEQEHLVVTDYRSPKIDVDELIKQGYISAEEYHSSHKGLPE